MSDLDEATRKQLERGMRITEVMKQKQYVPMSIGEQAFILYAVDRGILDSIPVNRISLFEQELRSYLHNHHRDLLKKIDASGDFNEAIENEIKSILETFKTTQAWD
jgi:F-type H+-transporting ATPase subunit alpha